MEFEGAYCRIGFDTDSVSCHAVEQAAAFNMKMRDALWNDRGTISDKSDECFGIASEINRRFFPLVRRITSYVNARTPLSESAGYAWTFLPLISTINPVFFFQNFFLNIFAQTLRIIIPLPTSTIPTMIEDNFLYTQLIVKLPYPTHSLSGQTIIVTGSNTGLGLEAARHFTRIGAAKVILAVRTVSKGETAKESIESSTNRKGVVEVWQLDLSSYESVKDFAKKVQKLDRLDALVENAGIATGKYSRSEDNESTITTNVVSTFLLALLLLPKLRESGQRFNITPHLTIVSSEVHAWSPFTERNSANIFDTLNNKETANMADRYLNYHRSSTECFA